MLTRLRDGLGRANKGIAYFAGALSLVMGLLLFVEVVLRYFFKSPTFWSQEVAIYMFTWAMFAGAAYTLQTGKHIRVDLIVANLPGRVQSAIEAATSLVGTVFCGFVAVQAWGFVSSAFEYGKLSATQLRAPLWIPQSSLLVGFVLLTLQFLFIFMEKAAALVSGEVAR